MRFLVIYLSTYANISMFGGICFIVLEEQTTKELKYCVSVRELFNVSAVEATTSLPFKLFGGISFIVLEEQTTKELKYCVSVYELFNVSDVEATTSLPFKLVSKHVANSCKSLLSRRIKMKLLAIDGDYIRNCAAKSETIC